MVADEIGSAQNVEQETVIETTAGTYLSRVQVRGYSKYWHASMSTAKQSWDYVELPNGLMHHERKWRLSQHHSVVALFPLFQGWHGCLLFV